MRKWECLARKTRRSAERERVKSFPGLDGAVKRELNHCAQLTVESLLNVVKIYTSTISRRGAQAV
jgi:hypothetical protein